MIAVCETKLAMDSSLASGTTPGTNSTRLNKQRKKEVDHARGVRHPVSDPFASFLPHSDLDSLWSR